LTWIEPQLRKRNKEMALTRQTPLSDWHQRQGGRMVDFSGWSLPINYPSGIISEHLACRKFGALFDISHMGRFLIKGPGALPLLRQVLTNDASHLQAGQTQYTLFSDGNGCPLDDAYLYQFKPREYLLVVNASNREEDWNILTHFAGQGVELQDLTFDLAMLAVQGPKSEVLLRSLLKESLPPIERGRTAVAHWQGVVVLVARTGYTGEPMGFELFLPTGPIEVFWQSLVETGTPLGIIPGGLGARDTLRLEAGLPLFGHELTRERPILSLPLAKRGVDLNPERGDFQGREALTAQMQDLGSPEAELVPRVIMAVAAEDKGMMRQGSPVLKGGHEVGELTSGTMVPAWKFEGPQPGEESFTRAIGLAYLDRDLVPGEQVIIQYRGRALQGRIVKKFIHRTNHYLQALSL
jgi:aminomethyltransferase